MRQLLLNTIKPGNSDNQAPSCQGAKSAYAQAGLNYGRACMASLIVIAGALLLANCNSHKPAAPKTQLYKQGTQSPTTNTQAPGSVQPLNSSTGKGDPVIVSMGGWNSCVATAENPTPNPYGMNNYHGFKLMQERIEAAVGKKVRYVVSCFSPVTTFVRFYSSAAPDTLREGTPAQLYEEIERLAHEGKGSLYMNGHSYGGWFVMQGVLALTNSVRIGLLSTMDAISPHTCDAAVMKDIAAKILNGTKPPLTQGCAVSPTDISADQRNAIRQKVIWWENYFQYDFLNVLHATPIAEASHNTEFKYPFPKSINGHINMGLDQTVWTNLADKMIADILKNK